eukprot:TCALIF_03409-PA protein Name:"Similar to mask Ankyrin repeat and KH domain-containing protein mask (Drosophila melanogaster)" AED:0.39 eAED:0.39 QI:0/0.33/0/0.5/1/0.75/4/0/415
MNIPTHYQVIMSVDRTLAKAIHDRNVEKIKSIFKVTGVPKDFGKNIWRGMRNESPIHFAAWLGHDEVLELFKSFGGNMNSLLEHQSGFRETVLHCAIKGNHLSTIKLLVHGFHVKTYIASSDGETPLQSAAKAGQNAVIRVLKEGGAHIDQHSVNVNGLKETALHCAIRHQHLDTAQLLLELGADATIHGHYFNLYQGSALDYAEQVKNGAHSKGILDIKTANDIFALLTSNKLKIVPLTAPNVPVSNNDSEASPLQQNSSMRRNPKSTEDLQLHHEQQLWERQVQALKTEQGANRKRLDELKSKPEHKDFLMDGAHDHAQYLSELEILMSLTDKKANRSMTMPPLNRSQSENSFRSKIPVKSGSTVGVRFPPLTSRTPSPRISQASSLLDLREERETGEGAGMEPQEWDPTLNE